MKFYRVVPAIVLCATSFILCESPSIAFAQAVADKQAAGSRALPASDEGMPGAGPVQRADWFGNLWQTRRNTFAERADSDREAVVFFGDSITQDWSDDFQGDFGSLKVANRGISGDTTRGMLYRIDDVLSLKPRGIVMLMGTNDLEKGAAPQTIVDNVKLILDKFKSLDAKMPIVLCRVMPSSGSKQRPADKVKQLNQLLADAVKGNEQVTVLDTYTLFANWPQGDAKVEEFPDLLHPNRVGYGKWKAGLLPLFATFGFVETTPDNFTPEAGFEMLFNGKDLMGWGFSPSTPADVQAANREPNLAWPILKTASAFDGKTQSDDGRFVAKNGRLIVMTPTEGRRIQRLDTTKEFSGDFVMKLEFRGTPNADSGVFLHGKQLQCRDYPLAGPYKNLTKYKPQDWNELVITVKDNKAHATCNGEVIEAAYEIPAKGPMGLEGDRGQMEYRRIRIKQGG